MAEQNPRIVATDDPALAESLGLDRWDEDRGQYVASGDDEAESAAVEPGEEEIEPDDEVEPGDEVTGDSPGGAPPSTAEDAPVADDFVMHSEDEEFDPNTPDDAQR